jgi:hypothetical protein
MLQLHILPPDQNLLIAPQPRGDFRNRVGELPRIALADRPLESKVAENLLDDDDEDRGDKSRKSSGTN